MYLTNRKDGEKLLYYFGSVSSFSFFSFKRQLAFSNQICQATEIWLYRVTRVFLAGWPVSGQLTQEIPRFHNSFVYILSKPLSALLSVTFTFLTEPQPSHLSLSPSVSLHGMRLTDSGCALMALHSASGTSASAFPPVHHHLPPHLCIKYQVSWKRREYDARV